MKIARKDLDWAASQSIITPEQASGLWEALDARSRGSPRFDLPHVAFYAGAIIVLLAMTFFMSLVWDALGGVGILVASIAYGVVFTLGGLFLWRRSTLMTAGGLLVTLAVFMVPLAIYGLGLEADFWTFWSYEDAYETLSGWVSSTYILLAISALLAAIAAILYIPFPALLLPIVLSAHLAILELTQFLLHDTLITSQAELLTLVFGLAVIMASYFADHRTEMDFASWGYFLGLVYFWVSLTLMVVVEEVVPWIAYLILCATLIPLSVFLERRPFIAFGALGVFASLGYFAYELFAESLLFPFVLSLIGIAIILLGVVLQVYGKNLSAAFARAIPPDLAWLQPKNR